MGQAPYPVTSPRRGRPWHLWGIATLFFALYVGGAWDFTNLLEPRVSYIEGQGWGAPAVDYFTDYPLPAHVLWGVSIVSGLVAAVLLLLRSRTAVVAAAIAAASQLALLVVTFSFMGRWEVLPAFTHAWDLGIGAVATGVWLYARRMRRSGVLG